MRSKYAVARRSIWYVLRALLVTAGVLLLALGLFVVSMNVSNLYVLTTEGMELRAKTILTDSSALELTQYFTEEFVKNDAILYEGRYGEFTVKTYNYRIDIDKLVRLPLGDTAVFRVTERMLDVSATQKDTSEGAEALTLPKWTDARYDIIFKIKDGRWYISELKLVMLDPPKEQKPTPDMSLMESPGPSATLKPSPSPSAPLPLEPED